MYGRLRCYFAASLVVAMLATCATAATFSDDFESYAVGSDVHGQGGWKGWDNTPAAGALISDTVAFSGTNSVAIAGGSDLVHEFDATGGQWTFSAMQYVTGNATGETYFILLNQYNDGGPNNWSIQTCADLNTGKIYAWDRNDGLEYGEMDVVRDQWVELKYDIDLDANTVDQYYNGTLMHTSAWYGAAPPWRRSTCSPMARRMCITMTSR